MKKAIFLALGCKRTQISAVLDQRKSLNGTENIQSINNTDAEVEFNIIQTKDCAGRHGGTGFCQLEPNETFPACYNAEKEEFCTDIISCLALDTNPTILILIAAACSCDATICTDPNGGGKGVIPMKKPAAK